MRDIVQRLRATHHATPASEDWELCCEAADMIVELDAENERLREEANPPDQLEHREVWKTGRWRF